MTTVNIMSNFISTYIWRDVPFLQLDTWPSQCNAHHLHDAVHCPSSAISIDTRYHNDSFDESYRWCCCTLSIRDMTGRRTRVYQRQKRELGSGVTVWNTTSHCNDWVYHSLWHHRQSNLPLFHYLLDQLRRLLNVLLYHHPSSQKQLLVGRTEEKILWPKTMYWLSSYQNYITAANCK